MKTNLKRFIVRLALISAVFVTGAAVSTDSYAAGIGTATATVVSAITISDSTQDLAFGALTSAAAGTVVIDTAGARTNTGGAVPVPASTHTEALFTVSGGAGLTYTVTLPAAPATITAPGPVTMTVDTFTSNPGTGPGAGLLGGGGTQTLHVGGTLNVGAAQAAGSYTGTFTVTVAYN